MFILRTATRPQSSSGVEPTARGRSQRRGLLATITASVFAAALIAAPSAGAVSFQANGSFTNAGMVFPVGIAVDSESGNVYVAQKFGAPFPGPGNLLRFDGSGNPLSPASMGTGAFAGVAVEQGGARTVYGYVGSGITAFDSSGSPTGSPFSVGSAAVGGIASDAAGDIYFPNLTTHVVDKYTSAGATGTPAQIGCASGNACGYLPFSEAPYAVAVDGSGNVYAAYPLGSERQAVDLTGVSGGTFALSFESEETGAQGTGDLASGSATGTGDLSEGSATLTNLNTESGAFEAGQGISGEGIPSDTYIVSVGSGELTLSNTAEINQSAVALTTNTTIVSNLNTSSGTFVAGEAISGTGIPAGTTIASVGTGRLTLSADATAAGSGVSLTAAIPYNAPEYVVQGALEALSAIGGGGVAVSQEASTYLVTFGGSHEHADVSELTADSSDLQGGTATVETINRAGGGVVKFAPSGSFDSYLYEGDAQALAIDTGSETVLVDGNDGAGFHVTAVDYAGNVVGEIPTSSFAGVILVRVAVNPTTEALYISEFKAAEKKVVMFNILAPPKAITGAASEVTATTATLEGTANPKGVLSEDCHLEYTDDADFQANEWANAESALCDPQPFNESTDVAVSAEVSGLSPETTYDYRVVETTEGGTSEGLAVQFTTLPPAPAATTGAASGISQTAATLNGTVDAEGADAACQFEYGTTTAYGKTAACSVNPVTGTTATAVSAALSGLTANTTYHFRVVAENSGGTTNGADQSFATLADTCATNAALCPPPPVVDTDGDGVADSSDQCVTVSGPASNNGCPVTEPPRNEAAYKVCVKKAGKAYKKALKKAHTPAKKKAAKNKKKKAIRKCAARYL